MTPSPEWAADDPRLTPILLRKELVAVGHDDRSIRRLVDAGVLARVKRGAYADATRHGLLDAAGRYVLSNRAALKQAKTDLVLSHASAAVEYDVPSWGLDFSLTHLTRLDGRAGRKEAGIQQHCGAVADGDIVTRNGVRMMSATRTALELTTIVGAEVGLVATTSLLHRGLTTLEQLHARNAGMVRWPGTLATDVVLGLARPEIESVGEARTFYLFYRQAVPMPQVQHEVRDRAGLLVARLDFAWPEHGVFVEFDGRIKYEKLLRDGERASDVVIREKQREELVCRLTGWRCVRLTWADLERPERTAALVRAALAGVAA